MFVRLALLGCIALLAIAATGVVLAATTSVQKEVRITARLLESGKVEFGLQERTDGGEWGEILLPTKNKFPYATADVDRWLRSSPVELTPVEFEAVDELEPEVEEPEVEEPEVEEPESDAGFGQWHDISSSGARGTTHAYTTPDADLTGGLMLGCSASGSRIAFVATDEYLLNDRGTDRITVYYRFEGGQAQSARWWSNENLSVGDPFQSWLASFEPEEFARFLSFSATQSTTFYFSVTDRYGDSFSGTFDVTGIHAVLEALPCFSVTG